MWRNARAVQGFPLNSKGIHWVATAAVEVLGRIKQALLDKEE